MSRTGLPSRPTPIKARWCHVDPIGNVVALRRMHGKLFAVAKCDLSPDDLAALSDEYGPLRWSASTRKVGRGPLTILDAALGAETGECRPAGRHLASAR